MCGYRARTNPVKRHEVPCQRPRNSADVDQPRRRTVPEIREAQIEEVDDKQEFGKPKVAPRPEVDEAEEQEVGGNVMRANVCCSGDIDTVGRVQRPSVDELQCEQDDPVDGGYDAVLGKGGGGVVAPDGVVVMVVGGWCAEGVVDCGDEEDDVGYEGGDAEEDELLGGVLFTAGEEVDWIMVSACCLRRGNRGLR